MSNPLKLMGVGFAAGIGAVAFGAWVFLGRTPGPELPEYGAVAPFRMTDHRGQPVTLQDLKGKVWIGDFIFTRCGGQCPLMTQGMKRLHAAIPGVTFVSITSDPEYDTPEILARYAENQGAVADNWLFLKGERAELDRVTASFHMGTIDEPLMHSTRFVLVDKAGNIRGYYDSENAKKIEDLKREARLLVG